MKTRKSKALSALSMLTIVVLVSLLIAQFLPSPKPFIQIAYAADVYGNDIIWIQVNQWNGTHWVERANFTVSGGSTRVVDSYALQFNVRIQFNDTLAANQAEAVSYTEVLMNITTSGGAGVPNWVNPETLNNTAVSGPTGGFYFMTETGEWNQTGYPAAGVTYVCNVTYRGYY